MFKIQSVGRYAGKKTEWNPDGTTYYDTMFDRIQNDLWNETGVYPKDEDVISLVELTIEELNSYLGDDDE